MIKQWLCIVAGWLMSQLAYAQEPVVLVSDPYPPYIMDEAHGKGFVTDIAIRALALEGIEARLPKRAIQTGHQGC